MGAYHDMLHDRFMSRWQQPTTIFADQRNYVTTVRIRIARDGSIVSAVKARSSDNVLMDESVMEAVRSVRRVEPLPDGYQGDTYEVIINFELN